MKVTVISIIILVLIPFASALDFTLNSPDSANLNESFSVNIAATTSDVYDVKIFIYKDSKNFSEIFNGSSWLSSKYYLISRFPQTKDYQVVSHFAGETNICARLRKANTNTSSYTEKCNAISIKQDSQVEENTNKTIPKENRTITQEVNKSSTSESDFIPAGSQIPSQNQIEPPVEDKNQERIVLTPKKEEIFVSNQEKIKLYSVYAFSFFALIVIIFLSLRKL